MSKESTINDQRWGDLVARERRRADHAEREAKRLRVELDGVNAVLAETNERAVNLAAEVERLKSEASDDQAMMIGLAKSYHAAKEKFGSPGQETWWSFPMVQGLRLVMAVADLAKIEGELSVSDLDGVMERAKRRRGGGA